MEIPILSDIFGRKPEVAGFQNVNLGQEQLTAILNNLKAFQSGNVQQLGNMYQRYMTGLYSNLIPNFTDILKQGGATTGQMLGQAGQFLQGLVPQDVQNLVRRSTAFQNLGSGLFGSAAGGANFARNLGLTSLDMISRGANLAGQAGNAAQRWAGIAQGTMLPSTSFMVTPQEQFAATTQNRLIQRQVQQEKFNVAAAPNPIAKGLSDLVAYLTASYIGHGPAGQPPKATDYSQLTGAQADQFGQAFGPEMEGLGLDNGGFETGGSAIGGWGGAGAGSSDEQAWPGAGDVQVGNLEDVSGVPSAADTGFNYNLPWEQNLYGVSDFNIPMYANQTVYPGGGY